MINIPVLEDLDGSLVPSEPIPADALAVVCDGTNYTVYQPGDTLPAPIDGATS
ncbi:hypothetical protein BX589_12078 [Paraburkholderia fungorum]|jgi:hypothetical protein|uniref:hypothetical protein n=1 Tax=Paraburkholderia fungorum TaxID=134537 RepID=UPI000D4885D6|nr:hypothetical protein [Paraburkholderia fungorum]PRZ51237.1 hypothetical protein BX589_12078 [Paraburkholderia fungorum]